MTRPKYAGPQGSGDAQFFCKPCKCGRYCNVEHDTSGQIRFKRSTCKVCGWSRLDADPPIKPGA